MNHRVSALALVTGAALLLGPASIASASVDAAAVLRKLGVDSGSLAASGLDDADVQAILGAIAESSGALPDFLDAAGASESAMASHAAAVAMLDPQSEDLATLGAQFDAARAAALAAAAALRAELLSPFDPAVATKLENCVLASAHRVPASWKVVARSAEEWSAVQSALRIEERAQRLGESVPEGAATLLAAVRGEPAVIGAATLLAANGPLIEAMLAPVPQ